MQKLPSQALKEQPLDTDVAKYSIKATMKNERKKMFFRREKK